jgi:hypothetical protein
MVNSLQNVTGRKEYLSDFYNLKTNEINTKFDGLIFPNVSYKIDF